MKKFYCIFLLSLCFNFSMIAQMDLSPEDATVRSFSYDLLTELAMYECDISGNVHKKELVYSPPRTTVTLLSEKGTDSLIIRLWKWEGNQYMQDRFNYTDSKKTDIKYFLVSKREFQQKAVKRYQTGNTSFTIGTVIVPVKMRMRQFNFAKDYTLTPMVGAKVRISKYNPYFVNVVGGLGLTSVTLDSSSTEGFVRQASDRPAITPSLGMVLEFSDVQVGLFSGWDFISKQERKAWGYQGKTWLSLGLGYSIFSRQGVNRESEVNSGQSQSKVVW